jgi:hypothetical protein
MKADRALRGFGRKIGRGVVDTGNAGYILGLGLSTHMFSPLLAEFLHPEKPGTFVIRRSLEVRRVSVKKETHPVWPGG